MRRFIPSPFSTQLTACQAALSKCHAELALKEAEIRFLERISDGNDLGPRAAALAPKLNMPDEKIEAKVDKLKAEADKLKAEADKLKAEVKDLKAEADKLEGKVKDLKKEQGVMAPEADEAASLGPCIPGELEAFAASGFAPASYIRLSLLSPGVSLSLSRLSPLFLFSVCFTVLAPFSSFAPSNLFKNADKTAELVGVSLTSIIYSFCGTSPIYVPPPAVPYVNLRPSEDDPRVWDLVPVLYMASPSFGLCEMLPENATDRLSDRFVLCGVAKHNATVQVAASNCAVKLTGLYKTTSTGTGSSVPDMTIVIENVEVGAMEFKSSTMSSVEGLPQAYLAAADMASRMYGVLPLEEIVVPFVSYTAAEELHGVVYLLEGGAPCFAVLAINRLETMSGCEDAARWRVAMSENGKRLVERLNELRQPPKRQTRSGQAGCAPLVSLANTTGKPKLDPKLDTSGYFLKFLPLQPSQPLRSQGEARSTYHKSLLLLELYEMLRKGGVPAALPLARLTTGTARLTSKVSDTRLPPVCFVFEDLAVQGFASGVPPDKELFLPWLLGAMEAIQLAHAAGVVHLDTHMHNFMWRENGQNPVPTPEGGWQGHGEAARLANSRNMRQPQSGGQAGPTEGAATFRFPRAGEVAATARNNRPFFPDRAGLRKVDVVLIDWDLALPHKRPVDNQVDMRPHSNRKGWCTSLHKLEVSKLPPLAPDWDMLRATLVLWLQHGPSYCPFEPLAGRLLDADNWKEFCDTHKTVSETLSSQDGGLGAEPDGLSQTLTMLEEKCETLKLDKERLTWLRDQLGAQQWGTAAGTAAGSAAGVAVVSLLSQPLAWN